MIEDNKDKQDLNYYNEVLDELYRLYRQTINRYSEFKSISKECHNIINMTLNNSIKFIENYKNEIERKYKNNVE